MYHACEKQCDPMDLYKTSEDKKVINNKLWNNMTYYVILYMLYVYKLFLYFVADSNRVERLQSDHRFNYYGMKCLPSMAKKTRIKHFI